MRIPTLALAFCSLALAQRAHAESYWAGPGGGLVLTLAADPMRAGTVYAGTGRGGIFQSTDAGKTWRRLTRGPRPTWIKAVAVEGTGRVFAAIDVGGVLESTDSLEHWTRVPTGSPQDSVDSLFVDRRTSPETIYAGTETGAVRSSVDGGKTWTGGGSGLPAQPVESIAPGDAAHPGTLWAGTLGGVFRSTDGGRTWTRMHDAPARALLIDPTRPGTIFAAHNDLFRSKDDGVTWRKLPSFQRALSLAIDASSAPATVYVGTSYDRVLKSVDAGETWTSAGNGLPVLGEVIGLAADPHTKPNTLYATTSTSGVYRSTDGGESWHADEGAAAEKVEN
jgi:photosystem II stability/assembly factor-like uncharacterized protein